MSLILAIEPNKSQAQQLGTLVRTHLKAELVTAASVTSGLASLGDRIPDLILTPALFGMRDETALTEHLRHLGNRASHVQTLAIPILAAAPARGASGILGRKKGDNDVGCDPAVFAEQIRIYLQRATVERRAQVSEASARAMAAPPPPATATASEGADDSSFFVAADEFDMDSLEIPELSIPAAHPAPAAAEKAARTSTSPGTTERIERIPGFTPAPQKAPNPLEAELGLVTPPAAGPPLWRVTESIEDFYGGVEVVEEPTPVISPLPAPATDAVSVSAAPGVPAMLRTAPRPRRTPAQPDDWTFFDPSQNAFKALIKRLDEIAGHAA